MATCTFHHKSMAAGESEWKDEWKKKTILIYSQNVIKNVYLNIMPISYFIYSFPFADDVFFISSTSSSRHGLVTMLKCFDESHEENRQYFKEAAKKEEEKEPSDTHKEKKKLLKRSNIDSTSVQCGQSSYTGCVYVCMCVYMPE